ncbi:MAG: arylsulfatase [Planctomycetes bacterium]|nr:arylsulfatase [Planctomycetota bacterium]
MMTIAVVVVCVWTSMCCSETRADRKPNIIYILADDLGYGDLGCYGQTKIKTPSIDQLAAQGMRFTQHYAGSTVCAPSRCSLLTGLHTGHTRIRGNTPVLLTPADVTVAEVLKAAGYDTACIGKWGVGHPPPPGDPANNGFDYFFGYLDMYHAHNYFPDFLWKNGSKVPLQGNVVKVIGKGGVALKRSQYSHDLFTNEAVSFIEAHANSNKPFFLYLPFTIPHANNEAGNEGMEVPNDAPYTLEKWPQAQKNHAAMISRLDSSVGKIVSILDNLKIAEQTLVIFTSDNGPHKEGGADPEFFKSSGTLRGIKRDLYEGGIRVPFIARWTGKIKPGSYSDHVSAFWDFLPTACELANAKLPANIDGLSYLPTLLGQSQKQKKHEFLYWEFHEQGSIQAVRMGDWKLVRFFQGQTELFDLKTDPSEKQNVAANHPDVVKMIEAHLKTARTASKDFPLAPRKPKKQPSPTKSKK